MVIDLLDKLHESGDLKLLFQSGMVSSKVILQRRIYHTYKSRTEFNSKNHKAVKETAGVHNVSTNTVYKIIRSMQS
jgi:hypothetical protein